MYEYCSNGPPYTQNRCSIYCPTCLPTAILFSNISLYYNYIYMRFIIITIIDHAISNLTSLVEILYNYKLFTDLGQITGYKTRWRFDFDLHGLWLKYRLLSLWGQLVLLSQDVQRLHKNISLTNSLTLWKFCTWLSRITISETLLLMTLSTPTLTEEVFVQSLSGSSSAKCQKENISYQVHKEMIIRKGTYCYGK